MRHFRGATLFWFLVLSMQKPVSGGSGGGRGVAGILAAPQLMILAEGEKRFGQ